MASGDEVVFARSEPQLIPPREVTAVVLAPPVPPSPHCHTEDGAIHFDTEGWYEVLLAVRWAPGHPEGTRFSHTHIPDQEPLHSEAIAADVLYAISGGKQLLRGNSLFGPDRTTCLRLEVWHDAHSSIELGTASLTIRELLVPWIRPSIDGRLASFPAEYAPA